MDDVTDLMTWLREQLDDEERVAREASRRETEGWTPTGEHWRWEETEHDQVLTLDPVTDEYLNEGGGVALRSVEQYPTRHVGDLPHFVVPHAEEVRTVDAMHIARHDPARVLAEVDAKRRILDLHMPDQSGFKYTDANTRVPNFRCSVCHDIPADVDYDNPPYAVEFPCPTVRLLALPHAGRDGYREDWRP